MYKLGEFGWCNQMVSMFVVCMHVTAHSVNLEMSLNFNKEVSHRNSHSVHIVLFIAAVLCVLYTFNCAQSD